MVQPTLLALVLLAAGAAAQTFGGLDRLGFIVPSPGRILWNGNEIVSATAYSYSFFVRIFSTAPEARNLFHKGLNGTLPGYTERNPSVWIKPSTTQLVLATSDAHSLETDALPVGQWTHITLVRSATAVNVYLNGALHRSATGLPTTTVNSGPLYVSGSGVSQQADAILADLRYRPFAVTQDSIQTWSATQPTGKFELLGLRNLQPGSTAKRVVATEAQLPRGAGYLVSFWIRPKGTAAAHTCIMGHWSSAGWTTRSPGIFFMPNTLEVGVWTQAVGGTPSLATTGTQLSLNTWTLVTYARYATSHEIWFGANRVAMAAVAAPIFPAGSLAFGDPDSYATPNADLANIRWYDNPALANAATIGRWTADHPDNINGHLFSGFLAPSSGQILVEGVDIASTHHTVSFWYQVQGVYSGEFRNILHKGSTDSERQAGVWQNPGTTSLHFSLANPTTVKEVNSNASDTSTPGRWYHIAYSRTDTQFMLFIDGKLRYTTSYGAIQYNSGPLYLGNPWINAISSPVFDVRYRQNAVTLVSDIKASMPVNPEEVCEASKAKYADSRPFIAAEGWDAYDYYVRIGAGANEKWPLGLCVAADGKIGFNSPRAFNFANSQQAVIAPHAALTPSPVYTIAFWIRPTGTNSAERGVLTKGINSARAPRVSILANGYKVSASFGIRGGTFTVVSSATDLPVNVWSMVTIVKTHTNVQIWYGNSQVANTAVSAQLSNSDPLVVGSQQLAPMAGQLALVRYRPYIVNPADSKEFNSWFSARPDFTLLGKTGLKAGTVLGEANQFSQSEESSWSLWVRPTAVHSETTALMGKGASSSDLTPQFLLRPAGTKVYAQYSTAGPGGNVNFGCEADRQLAVGNWTMVTLVRSYHQLQLFYGTTAVCTATVNQSPAYSQSALLGSQNTGVNYPTALAEIANVRFRVWAATSAELTSWNAQNPGEICADAAAVYTTQNTAAATYSGGAYAHWVEVGQAASKAWPAGYCTALPRGWTGTAYLPTTVNRNLGVLATKGQGETWSFLARAHANGTRSTISPLIKAPGFEVFQFPNTLSMVVQVKGLDGIRTFEVDGPLLKNDAWTLVTFVRSESICALWYDGNVVDIESLCQPGVPAGGPVLLFPGTTATVSQLRVRDIKYYPQTVEIETIDAWNKQPRPAL